MSKKYTIEERKIFQEYVFDGALAENLFLMLPDRSYRALTQQANFLGFGIKKVDGVKYFTRLQKKKDVGEECLATVQEPTTEHKNASIDIISKKSNVEKLLWSLSRIENMLYESIEQEFEVHDITVNFNNMTLSMRKEDL